MNKKKILFVCLGNICRSPSAEGIMKALVKKEGLSDNFEIDSAGLTGYHAGEMPDSRMRMHASRRGYSLDSRSRPVTVDDFDSFDLIIGMDDQNIQGLRALAPCPEAEKKVRRMTDFCHEIRADHVPDPYYGGSSGFERVLDILEDACAGLLDELK